MSNHGRDNICESFGIPTEHEDTFVADRDRAVRDMVRTNIKALESIRLRRLEKLGKDLAKAHRHNSGNEPSLSVFDRALDAFIEELDA